MTSHEYRQLLKKEYPYRIELHTHTSPASECSEISPEELAKIYARKGYHGFVVTNHFSLAHLSISSLAEADKQQKLSCFLSDYQRASKAANALGISAFLGLEMRFPPNSNDYLLYGVDSDIASVCYDYLDKEVSVFRSEVKLPNSVFLQAHPFRNGMERCDPSLLDGIESFNMHPDQNQRTAIAARYAMNQNMNIVTAGSDFHLPNRGYEALTAMRTRVMPKTSFDIAKILKEGDYIFELGENSILLA